MRRLGASLFLFTIATQGAQIEVHPTILRQGETIRITAREPLATATLAARTVKFFIQEDGSRLALMPVPAREQPGKYEIAIRRADGSVAFASKIEVQDANFPVQDIIVGRSTKALKPLPGEMEAVANLRDAVTDKRLWDEPFVNPTSHCMNSLFGIQRYHNGKPTGNYHRGVDLRSPRGTPIRAVAGGRVRISRMFRLNGGTVGLDHGQGMTSIYLHMSRLRAREGQFVRKGEIIGYVGSTGFATGPHLHWQLSVNGIPVNPDQWLPNVPRCI